MTPRHGPSARLPAVLSAITARVSGVCPGRGPRELSLGVTRRPGWCRRLSGHLALVAQRIEHLTTDQKVGGSSPSERASKLAGQGSIWSCNRPSERSAGPGFATLLSHRLEKRAERVTDDGP